MIKIFKIYNIYIIVNFIYIFYIYIYIYIYIYSRYLDLELSYPIEREYIKKRSILIYIMT